MNFRVALVLLTVTIAPAFAQSGPGEDAQRQACMGDALRLCSSYIPDRGQIRNCMAAQQDQLSPQCRAVFDASVQALKSQSSRSR